MQGNILTSESYRRLDESLSWEGDCLVTSLRPSGRYGMLKTMGIPIGTHVAACFRAHGPAPLPGMHARHSCHNTRCCNPDHLSWGSLQDNEDDKAMAGRRPKAQPKLQRFTPLQIERIRAALQRGMTQRALADLYGIVQSNISKIARGETYKEGI